MLLDEVEEDVDPFRRREVRVVLLIRALRVSDARKHLGDAFHLQRIAQPLDKSQGRFGRPKRCDLDVWTGGELLKLMAGLVGEPLGRERAKLILQLDEETAEVVSKVKAARTNGDPEWLLELAEGGSLALSATSLLLSVIADALIALEKEREALKVLEKGKAEFPLSVRMKQLEGLALRRIGEFKKAQRVLGELYADGHRDPETMGIYAATWAKRSEQENNRDYLAKSRQLYAEAFALDPRDSCVGVNAASKAAQLGKQDKAKALANQVAKLESVTSATSGEKYWDIATHAEVRLLQGEYELAAQLYRAAVVGSPAEKGSHGTTLDQLQKLIAGLQVPEAAAQRLLASFRGS